MTLLVQDPLALALPDGLAARPATMADAAAVTEMLNLSSLAQVGARDLGEDDLAREWQTPGQDVARNVVIVETPTGQIVAYADIWVADEPPVTPGVWCRVHPDWEGRGIGTALLQWGEGRAREEMARVPDDLRVALRAWAISTHEPTARRYRDYGMTIIRHFWRMVRDLDAPPPAPQWDEGIALRLFDRERDGLAVYRAIDEAFEDHWGHTPEPEAEGFARWSHYVFDPARYDPMLWFVAMDGDDIAGVARCSPSIPEDAGMGWVNQLAVRRPWRRRGLGLALLLHSFGEFYRRGQPRVGLGVDAANRSGATRLYERAGMRVARQFDTYEKELRPGRELDAH